MKSILEELRAYFKEAPEDEIMAAIQKARVNDDASICADEFLRHTEWCNQNYQHIYKPDYELEKNKYIPTNIENPKKSSDFLLPLYLD